MLTTYDSQAENWYDFKKACTNVVANNKYAQSTMIYGNQWDETMSWLKTTIFKNDETKVDQDSSSWGNYKETAVLNSEGTVTIKNANSETTLNTGETTFTMKNNIYDLAGNYYEWTQEVVHRDCRVLRGGSSYAFSGSENAAADRGNCLTDRGHSCPDSARVALYIK